MNRSHNSAYNKRNAERKIGNDKEFQKFIAEHNAAYMEKKGIKPNTSILDNRKNTRHTFEK